MDKVSAGGSAAEAPSAMAMAGLAPAAIGIDLVDRDCRPW